MDGTPGVTALWRCRSWSTGWWPGRLSGAAVAGLTYAVLGLGRAGMSWLLTTMIVVLAAYALAFALLMSQRLRRLVEKLFRVGPWPLAALYLKLSDSRQVYRTHAGALVVAFGWAWLPWPGRAPSTIWRQ